MGEAADTAGSGAPDRRGAQQAFVMNAYDMFNKWGFEDGDLFNDLIVDYARQAGFGSAEDRWHYLSSHRLLWHAYHRFVARPEYEPVLYVRTSHNPIRARSDWFAAEPQASEPNAATEPVIVPRAELLELCAELFPPRPEWWLTLDRALWGGAWALADENLAPLLGGVLPPEDPTQGITDQAVERFALSPDAAMLVARLLLDSPYRVWDPKQGIGLADAAATARAALS
jgi:hypothetical protein